MINDRKIDIHKEKYEYRIENTQLFNENTINSVLTLVSKVTDIINDIRKIYVEGPMGQLRETES